MRQNDRQGKILFTDLDGPILDCRDRYYALYLDIVDQFGGQPISLARYWDGKRNRVNEKELLSLARVAENDLNQCASIRLARIEQESYLEKDFLQSNALDLLDRLKSRFERMVLVTMRRNTDGLIRQLRRLGIHDCFDDILTGFSDQIPGWQVKVNLIKERFQGNTETPGFSGYFVGDTEVDIRAGKELGLQTVAVLSGIRTRTMLESLEPDVVVEDLQGFYNHMCTG